MSNATNETANETANGQTQTVMDFSDDEATRRLFDQMFERPGQQYTVTPVDTEVACAWLREHARHRHFGWTQQEQQPMLLNDVISLDELYYRNSCGYAYPLTPEDEAANEHAEAGSPLCFCGERLTKWGSPVETDEETNRRLCLPWQCPVASEAYASDLQEHYPDLWRSDYSHQTDDDGPCGDWMILDARPRDAFVANIHVVGCEDVGY